MILIEQSDQVVFKESRASRIVAVCFVLIFSVLLIQTDFSRVFELTGFSRIILISAQLIVTAVSGLGIIIFLPSIYPLPKFVCTAKEFQYRTLLGMRSLPWESIQKFRFKLSWYKNNRFLVIRFKWYGLGFFRCFNVTDLSPNHQQLKKLIQRNLNR